ncbi:MAG TPA: hypothetical protein VMU42_00395, partial [Candidatus Sulfotelmatobacter sp.]|nr:hypothetical protein [Candidatus Sulfotelmatobacter sp.]
SIRLPKCEVYMDARDRGYAERYLRPFAHYDYATKYPHFLPKKRIADYRDIIEEAFPRPILF